MNSPSNIISGTIAELPQNTGIPLVFVGLGSNLGTTDETSTMILCRAFVALAELSEFPLIVSSLWRTAPVDCPPGSPDFVNAVAALLPACRHDSSEKVAVEVLAQLQQIEREFGRVRGDVQNAARTLDLDLLICGALQLTTSALTVPHPRLQQRAFVLAPMAEIAPGYILPGQNLPVEILLKATQIEGRPERDVQRINIFAPPVTL